MVPAALAAATPAADESLLHPTPGTRTIQRVASSQRRSIFSIVSSLQYACSAGAAPPVSRRTDRLRRFPRTRACSGDRALMLSVVLGGWGESGAVCGRHGGRGGTEGGYRGDGGGVRGRVGGGGWSARAASGRSDLPRSQNTHAVSARLPGACRRPRAIRPFSSNPDGAPPLLATR